MAKIKRYELNLAELIEYVWKNEITDTTFYTKDNSDTRISKVHVNQFGDIDFREINAYYNKVDRFIVEEEINEDTILPELLVIYKPKGEEKSPYIYHNESIKSILGYAKDIDTIESISVITEDSIMILLWNNGKLVKD